MKISDEDKETMIRSIKIDPHISNEQKTSLVASIKNEDSFYRSLFRGAIGSGIGYSIAKFLKLSKTSQVVITIAGFGIGKYLLDSSDDSGKFMEYDKKLKGYKINA